MLALPADDVRMRALFTETLLEAPVRELGRGLSLASDIGPAAAPVLLALAAAEKSNMRRRMSVFCATALAAGPDGDDRMLGFLGDRSPLQDRLCVCLSIALGPVRQRPQPDFWNRVLGRNQREPEAILLVAALLASSRFPGAATECPAPLLRVDNPGIVAAALFAGAPVSEAVSAPFLRPRPPAHASLVQRGWLLHAAMNETDPGEAVTARAHEFMGASGDPNATVRECAALALGRSAAMRIEGASRPDWRSLRMMVWDQRASMAIRSWLNAAPQPLEEPAWPRLAVGYALGRPVSVVIAERSAWGAVPAVAPHVAIALAMRLCAEDGAPQMEPLPFDSPEWGFVRWAAGGGYPEDQEPVDAALRQAAAMAREDRLTREAARSLFESTLWRWGSHPGLGRRDAQHDLIRDLLISGSLPGNRFAIGLPEHQRYLPAGLGSDSDFFGIAVEYWEHLRKPRLPMPAECRLR